MLTMTCWPVCLLLVLSVSAYHEQEVIPPGDQDSQIIDDFQSLVVVGRTKFKCKFHVVLTSYNFYEPPTIHYNTSITCSPRKSGSVQDLILESPLGFKYSFSLDISPAGVMVTDARVTGGE